MDLIVLAEGIESADELQVLRAAGINLFQGFYFAKPMIGELPVISFGVPLQTSRSAVA